MRFCLLVDSSFLAISCFFSFFGLLIHTSFGYSSYSTKVFTAKPSLLFLALRLAFVQNYHKKPRSRLHSHLNAPHKSPQVFLCQFLLLPPKKFLKSSKFFFAFKQNLIRGGGKIRLLSIQIKRSIQNDKHTKIKYWHTCNNLLR